MKQTYLITTLLLASSAALMGSEAPKKAMPKKASPSTFIPNEKQANKETQTTDDEQPQTTKKKGIKEMALVNLGVFTTLLGVNYLTNYLFKIPQDAKKDIAWSALCSTLGTQLLFPAILTAFEAKDPDYASDEYWLLPLSKKNLRTYASGSGVFLLTAYGLANATSSFLGQNPGTAKVVASIATSLALPPLLAKLDGMHDGQNGKSLYEWLREKMRGTKKDATEATNSSTQEVQ